MLNIFFFLIIIVLIFSFVAVPLIAMFKNTFGNNSGTKKGPQDAKYTRQVHHIHIKDAAGERKHRLDQLKSLYDAGMMERDEYFERIESVESDYRERL